MSHLFSWEEINFIKKKKKKKKKKKLQEPGIGLDACVIHMDMTKIFFNQNKDRWVSESVKVKQSARK